MTSFQSADRVDDILPLFLDGLSFSETDLKEAITQVAQLDISSYEDLLLRLASPPSNVSRPVLELLLSSSESRDILSSWLINDLPILPDYFSVSSTSLVVLKKISLSIPFLHSYEREMEMKLNKYQVKIEYGPRVIEGLSFFIAASNPSQEIQQSEPLDNFFYAKTSQRSRKDARTRAPIVFDTPLTKACECLNISIPSTAAEARHERHALVESLSNIFRFYLSLLCDPVLASAIRERFIRGSNEIVEVTESQKEQVESREIKADGNHNIPSAYPMVQPLKAALYFETADGFGEWRILISTRADRDLRDARRRDKKFFTIIVKKIKEISNGRFSDDNHKCLSGSQTQIPIYEAKMTRDSRLIYQIDCVPEYDTGVERQVVKIFGVYTHAQIDKRLWGSLSHQLMKRGSEYRRRCLFRNQLVPGDKVYTPACFPQIEKEAVEDDEIIPLPTETLEEIHSLLVLEKFIIFSQALLNSMIADLDIAHVFDVSPAEMEIIQHPYSCYVLGRSGTGKTTTMLFKMLGIQRAFEVRKDTMRKPRQVFVTKSRVLAVKVEEYFTKLLDSLSTGHKTKEELAEMIKSKRQQQQDESLVDIDDDQNWRPDLPSKYSELRDEHFPLFLTFDQLALLLEADIGLNLTSTLNDNKGPRIVTYDVFENAYWPHFSQTLKKGLDPVLVYNEFIGVLEGSEESLLCQSNYLDKTTYENLSSRTQYAFATRRDVIYSLFLSYIKCKNLAGDYDAADRTHRILHAFRSVGVPGEKFDYLYVDEAQDNLLIDALLLRNLILNPDGMFWAGDTAQTISAGSSFRFNDLKAFLFRLEKRRQNSSHCGASFIQEAPRTFHLTTNYRSHGGIVRCAHSVIELITNFWPYAIDILSRETGVVDGCKPVFFSGWDSTTVRYEQFLFGDSGRPVEFGAQQCILVRNESARKELQSQVGEIGLILTLYESKGLEFNDVLLYKFFEDSSADLSQWRVVLSLLKGTTDMKISVPEFDNSRHAGLCTELKFLYVAITRARKNMWIVDCSEKSEPMRIFWKSRDEVQCCTPGSDIPRLAVSSTPEEWAKTGRTLFTNKRYIQAMHCFERAGLDREAVVAHAYFLREQARAQVRDDSKQSALRYREAFGTAAEAFLRCSLSTTNPKEKSNYLRNAGECFENAEEYSKAAETFSQVREYTRAVKLYRKIGKFDEAVDVVSHHRSEIEEQVVENVVGIAKLFYFRAGELEKARKLFDTIEEQLEYLEDFDLDVSRAALLEELGRYQEAADIHHREGRTLEAIRLFLKDSTDPISLSRGGSCILDGLWENLSFGRKPSDRLKEVEILLDHASTLGPSSTSDSRVNDELSMFMAIKSRDHSNLRVLGTKFESQGRLTSALFCLDHAFSTLLNISGSAAPDLSEFLRDFLLYCRTLYRLAITGNPCQDQDIRRLFGILPSNGSHFLLPPETFLYKALTGSRVHIINSDERGVLISELDLSQGFKDALLNRLKAKLEEENEACKRGPVFHPCLPFIINNGHCNRRNCPNGHVVPTLLGQDWLRIRIKVHFQQMLVIQGFKMIPMLPNDKNKQFQFWIGSLFETLFPPLFRLGHLANFDLSTIPEAQTALPVLREYCKEIVFRASYAPRDQATLLTTAYQVTRILLWNTKAHVPVILQSPLNDMLSTIPAYNREAGNSKQPIFPELLYTVTGSYPQGLHVGILALRHILEKMVPIEANVMFDFVDILCGSLILLRRKGDLHNVTLPRSMLNNLFRIVKLDLTMRPSNFTALIDQFVLSLQKLMDAFVVHNQLLGHLLYEKSDLFDLWAYRPVFISRLCRTMALVGYNVNNEELRARMVSSFKSLNNLKPVHSLFRDYTSVWHWSGVARALQKSITDTPLDEIIQLYHANEVIHAKPTPRGIRRVVYKNTADIPKLLDGTLSFSNLRADAPAFVPRPPVAEDLAQPEGEAEVEEPEVDNSEIVNSAPIEESTTIAEIPDDSRTPSEHQDKAAIFLQTMYCRRLRFRKTSNRALDASRNGCFQKCLEEAAKMEWPKRHYRLLFLGPLPHVHVCLDAASAWVMENKARNKKRFKSAMHQELDDINNQLTAQKKIINEIKGLQKALGPQSQLHRKRDIEELKKLVLQVEEMLGRVAPRVAEEVEEDIQRAIKGIVTEKQPPKPKSKPTLSIEDDGYDEVD